MKYQLISQDEAFIFSFCRRLERQECLKCIGVSTSFKDCVNNIYDIYNADLIFIDENISLPFLISFIHLFIMKSTMNEHTANILKIIIKSAVQKEKVDYTNIGFDLVIDTDSADFTLGYVCEKLQEKFSLIRRKKSMMLQNQVFSNYCNQQIANILATFRIPPIVSGYDYLFKAMKICCNDIDHIIGDIDKSILSAIAYKERKTCERIERSMYHAISTGWYYCAKEHSQIIFHDSLIQPGIGEFVAGLSNYIILTNNIKLSEKMTVDFAKYLL